MDKHIENYVKKYKKVSMYFNLQEFNIFCLCVWTVELMSEISN